MGPSSRRPHLPTGTWGLKLDHRRLEKCCPIKSSTHPAAAQPGCCCWVHIYDCCAPSSDAAVMLSHQYGPKSLRNVCSTLLFLCHKLLLRCFWMQKWVRPVTTEAQWSDCSLILNPNLRSFNRVRRFHYRRACSLCKGDFFRQREHILLELTVFLQFLLKSFKCIYVLRIFKSNSHHTNLFLFQTFHGKFLITWAALQQEAVLRHRLIRDGRGRGRRGWAGMGRKCASSTNYKHDPSGHLRVIVYVHHCLPLVPVCFFTSAGLQSCKRWAEVRETITSLHARLLPSSRGNTCGFSLWTNNFSVVSHVQLQLLSGQTEPRGKAPEQVQSEELRLLHEDRLPLFFSHPVAHHRQLGAFCHLRTAGEDCSR